MSVVEATRRSAAMRCPVWWLLLFVAAAAPVPKAAPPKAAPPKVVPPKVVPPKAPATQAVALLDADYVNFKYKFMMNRAGMVRSGVGEVWLNFLLKGADRFMQMRLQGEATSPEFGKGDITIIVDGANKAVYSVFHFEKLHEEQCVKYPFPDVKNYAPKMAKLKKRSDQVGHRQDMHAKLLSSAKAFKTQWTGRKTLQLDLDTKGAVKNIQLNQAAKVIRKIEVVGGIHTAKTVPPAAAAMFKPPLNCHNAATEFEPIAKLKILGPHAQSSALSDLLLVLARHDPTDTRFFQILSVFAVPGDVAVMVEAPRPPPLQNLGAVGFDYRSTDTLGGVQHVSSGSVIMNVAERAFHLQGTAKATRLGALVMDLVVQGHKPTSKLDSPPTVYANVNLTVQKEQQCVSYPYPKINPPEKKAIDTLAMAPLKFLRVTELNGDDCSLFEAVLPRSRFMRLYVDLESDHPEAVLRAEIFRSGKLRRTTDIIAWHVQSKTYSAAVLPDARWKCGATPKKGKLANMGLNEVHKRSMEVQDALYALENSPKPFAVMEILALPGDLAIMVDEPQLPDFSKLAGLSFSYKLGTTAGTFNGDFKAKNPLVLQSASPGKATVRLDLPSATMPKNPLYASVTPAPGTGKASCQSLPPGTPATSALSTVVGSFKVTEACVHTFTSQQGECNRFTYLGDSAQIDLLYNIDGNYPQRLEIHSKTAKDKTPVIIDISKWTTHAAAWSPTPACSPAASAKPQWLTRQPGAAVRPHDPAGETLDFVEALGVVGLIPRSSALSVAGVNVRLPGAPPAAAAPKAVAPKPAAPKPAAPKPAAPKPAAPAAAPAAWRGGPPHAKPGLPNSALAPGLKSFSFDFSSVIDRPSPFHEGRERQFSDGKMTVDLARRRFVMEGEISGVGPRMPKVKSKVIFNSEQGKLYSYTQIAREQFTRCWSVGASDSLAAPAGGVQPNPFLRGHFAGSSGPEQGGPADRYSLTLGPGKRAEFMLDQKTEALASLLVKHVWDDASTTVEVTNWSTAAPVDALFEPGAAWDCKDMRSRDSVRELARWDLVALFFPQGEEHDSFAPTERRLDADEVLV
eukprot:TRINITY_DN4355_c0_g1_i1.p1 TRINITY_DN4355_c0_g1~~TRINITY_DN4355_c0_g1_i1.p1  ORF type:complete len:1077 (+),score=268.25 TRINITY_DN4355_c0_g1_i1:129-3359(+)